ncbi:MAG TPA: TMEM175 family protein [Chthoniobacterales bacterium]|nr:TMEM175 family protein [Chthoniobacterales bacterium]
MSTSTRDEEISSGLPPNLDELPRLRGFRLRGIEMTRLETFIDAAFAFAVTVMVIAAERVPDDSRALLDAFKNVPAFLASVAVLAIFWRGHWLWSRRYGLEDGVSIFISWALLATILIYIYPLKAVFGSMFFFLSGGRLGHALGARVEGEARVIFAVYAIGVIALGAEILLLYLRAWTLRRPLRLNAREESLTRAELSGWCIPIAVGTISLVLSQILPARHFPWCGWVYFSMAILVPMYRVWVQRRAPK